MAKLTKMKHGRAHSKTLVESSRLISEKPLSSTSPYIIVIGEKDKGTEHALVIMQAEMEELFKKWGVVKP